MKNIMIKLLKFLLEEKKTISNLDSLKTFQKDVLTHITDFKSEIIKLKDKGYKIGGYGASGRANMFCNIIGLDSNDIQFIVDESPERCGRYIANTDIPIVSPDVLKESDIDLLVIFAWNYSKMIVDKTKYKNCEYMIAFPTIQYFKNSEIGELNLNSI